MSLINDFSKRAELVEEMDKPDCDQALLYTTLRRFEVTNRLFTRYRTVLRRHVLNDMRREPERTYQFTELGAGGCDVARWLVRVCRRENLKITVRSIDGNPRTVRYARRLNVGYPEIEVVEADACDPACWGKPDYLFAQHLLHHLPAAACVQLLQALGQASSRQFIISDLVRSRAAYHAFRIVARPLGVGSFIVDDGCTSIRRGFLESEIKQMVDAAQMQNPVTTYRLFPSRLVIVGGTRNATQHPHPNPLVNCPLLTVNCPLLTALCPLPTAHCPLPTAH